MPKEAVFTMKLEPELRAEFIAEAEAAHRPASQVVLRCALALVNPTMSRSCSVRLLDGHGLVMKSMLLNYNELGFQTFASLFGALALRPVE